MSVCSTAPLAGRLIGVCTRARRRRSPCRSVPAVLVRHAVQRRQHRVTGGGGLWTQTGRTTRTHSRKPPESLSTWPVPPWRWCLPEHHRSCPTPARAATRSVGGVGLAEPEDHRAVPEELPGEQG